MNSIAAVVIPILMVCGTTPAAAHGRRGMLQRAWEGRLEEARHLDAPARLEPRPLRFREPPGGRPADEPRALDEATGGLDFRQPTADEALASAAPQDGFGSAGEQFWTFGAGVAHNFHEDMDYNLHIAWSRFFADELEFMVEGGLWYFAQDGDDTVGLNGNLIMRWHFHHAQDWDWSVYSDVGMGLMGSFDNVPATGSGFTFTPRAGFGATKRLSSDGTRLVTGVRWHHISNGRIEGDLRNPSRDSIMVYAGVAIPF